MRAFGLSKALGLEPEPTPGGTVADDTNPLFAPAFFRLLDSGRPALLVYSGGDRLQAQFEEKFVERNRSRIDPASPGYLLHTIPGANHIMSDPQWTAELLDVAAKWLDRSTRPPQRPSFLPVAWLPLGVGHSPGADQLLAAAPHAIASLRTLLP